jgi:hypothetical protein
MSTLTELGRSGHYGSHQLDVQSMRGNTCDLGTTATDIQETTHSSVSGETSDLR